MSRHELPKERLGTLDPKGKRIFPHPMAVRGFFRKYRTYVYWALIVFFMVLPWIKIGGHQAVLIDIPNRQFAFFGLTFWAHDIPLIFFLLAGGALTLALVTAVWGRVWCGWACPQTVFIDAIYRKVETWIEGNHTKRMKLDQAPWSKEKIFKKSLKWLAYFIISAHIAHSFAAYFVGAEELLKMSLMAPTENWTTFLIVFFITALLMFDFGWFREQFCVIMCPYGRIQSVLMDDDSLAVVYDPNRGEPRKGYVPEGETQGDCINCFKCVAVCPTGIDIRRGIQMECIACTACIDACDEVMEKIKKPKGLIRYDSEGALSGKPKKVWKPRTFIYLTLVLLSFVGLFYFISQRTDVHLQVLRTYEEPYKKISDNELTNHFKVRLKNQLFDPVKVSIESTSDNIELIAPMFPLELAPGEDSTPHFFVKFKDQLTQESGKHLAPVRFKIISKNSDSEILEQISLVGPIKK